MNKLNHKTLCILSDYIYNSHPPFSYARLCFRPGRRVATIGRKSAWNIVLLPSHQLQNEVYKFQIYSNIRERRWRRVGWGGGSVASAPGGRVEGAAKWIF